MFIDYMVTGSVENGLISDLKKKKCLVFVLIDSEIANVNTSVRLAKDSEAAGASAILVGAQVRSKLASFYYTQALLLSLGVIKASDMNVIIDLSKQIDILKDSDIFPEKEDEVIRVIELIVKQACNS